MRRRNLKQIFIDLYYLMKSITKKQCGNIQQELSKTKKKVIPSATFFKVLVIEVSINSSVIKEENWILERLTKKFTKGKEKKRKIYQNLNFLVIDLSSQVLSNEKYYILKSALKYGLANRPKIFASRLKHCVCSVLKRRGDYVKTSSPRCFDVEYTWGVCRYLTGGFFSTDVFRKLCLFYLRNKLVHYFY